MKCKRCDSHAINIQSHERDEIKNIDKGDKCINGYVWSKHTNNTMMYKHRDDNGNFVECIEK